MKDSDLPFLKLIITYAEEEARSQDATSTAYLLRLAAKSLDESAHLHGSLDTDLKIPDHQGTTH